jgi:hypothetical protein
VTPVEFLVSTALRHSIDEANVEAGFERFEAITGRVIGFQEFRDTVDACLRESLIKEPIRLSERALQCRWRLELTPHGIAVARLISA